MVKVCLEKRLASQGTGLTAWITPTDDRTFALTLKYNPAVGMGADASLLTSVTFRSDSALAPPSVAEQALISPGTDIRGERSVSFSRMDPSKSVTVTVNTTYASAVLKIPAISKQPVQVFEPEQSGRIAAQLKYGIKNRSLLAAQNIRQVTKTAEDEYQVQFERPFASSNYVAVVSTSDGNARIIRDTPGSLVVQLADSEAFAQFSLIVVGELSQ